MRTFVPFGLLFPEQLELMEGLDAQRAWDSLTPGQQTERLARAKREEEGRQKAAQSLTAARQMSPWPLAWLGPEAHWVGGGGAAFRLVGFVAFPLSGF